MSSGGLELLTLNLEPMNIEITEHQDSTNPPLLIASVSSSCLPLFEALLKLNTRNGWVNPVFKQNNNKEYKDNFFTVEIDDFLEIESNHEVNVFRVSKRWDEIILYCQRVVYN